MKTLCKLLAVSILLLAFQSCNSSSNFSKRKYRSGVFREKSKKFKVEDSEETTHFSWDSEKSVHVEPKISQFKTKKDEQVFEDSTSLVESKFELNSKKSTSDDLRIVEEDKRRSASNKKKNKTKEKVIPPPLADWQYDKYETGGILCLVFCIYTIIPMLIAAVYFHKVKRDIKIYGSTPYKLRVKKILLVAWIVALVLLVLGSLIFSLLMMNASF